MRSTASSLEVIFLGANCEFFRISSQISFKLVLPRKELESLEPSLMVPPACPQELLWASGTAPVWLPLSCYTEPTALCWFLRLAVMTFSRLSHFLSLHMPFLFSWPKSILCNWETSLYQRVNELQGLVYYSSLESLQPKGEDILSQKRNLKLWHCRGKNSLNSLQLSIQSLFRALGCAACFPSSALLSSYHPHS